MKEPKVLKIAEKHGKSPAQILVRFQIQLGNVVIPKSVTKDRIIKNIEVFDFELSEDDLSDLKSFNHTERICSMADDKDHPDYPFHED